MSSYEALLLQAIKHCGHEEFIREIPFQKNNSNLGVKLERPVFPSHYSVRNDSLVPHTNKLLHDLVLMILRSCFLFPDTQSPFDIYL
jgi:hypothetical protein